MSSCHNQCGSGTRKSYSLAAAHNQPTITSPPVASFTDTAAAHYWREIPKQLANLYSEFRLSLTLRSKSQARRFIAIKVGIIAEEEQTF